MADEDGRARRRARARRPGDEVGGGARRALPRIGVRATRTASPSCYVDRADWADVARRSCATSSVHAVPRHHRGRPPASTRRASTPAGVAPERFEVVGQLLSHPRNRRIRVICQVPADDPAVVASPPICPGANFAEREVFDMFGIDVRGPPRPDPHPDARRLGGPPAAQGRRRRRVPVHVQGRPGPAMTAHVEEPSDGARREPSTCPRARMRRHDDERLEPGPVERQTDEGAPGAAPAEHARSWSPGGPWPESTTER